MQPDEKMDLRKLRYALYVRKSTEDDARQVRSIDDQIKDCRKLAKDLGLHVVGEPLKEMKSAKKPGRRPVFDQMLSDIKAKKYDAILCWHPDRLSRNMLESGMIIDMLDEHVLQDIRFHSHQFSNDANGKMLLGMLFVFSKQYSDDLSTKVSRGVKGNFSEGKSSGAPKHGYDRNEVTGLYLPNKFFNVIQEAWKKRASGDSLETVTQFLLEKNYHKITKDKSSPRKIKPTVTTMGDMFQDPFYYGILVQASQTIDLREVYDFKPATTKEVYDAVQMLGYGRTKNKPTAQRPFMPLQGFVYCAVCNDSKYMRVGRNKNGSGQYVLTYRCDNLTCERSPKSLRAKHIFNSIYTMLDILELTDKAYERYSKRLDTLTDSKVIKLKQEQHSLEGTLSHVKKEAETIALSLGKMDDTKSLIYTTNEKRVNELAIQQADLREKIEKIKEKLASPNKIKLSKQEFLNVIKTASDKMRAGSAAEKDVLCRILFLNVRVDNEKVASYLWNEPFASLVKATQLQSGRGDPI